MDIDFDEIFHRNQTYHAAERSNTPEQGAHLEIDVARPKRERKAHGVLRWQPRTAVGMTANLSQPKLPHVEMGRRTTHTPIFHCRLSRALEPLNRSRFYIPLRFHKTSYKAAPLPRSS